MERIHIVKKSVTKLDVDCVVNAANEGLWAGGGVCGAIFKEAGYNELTDACTKIGHCDTGNAVITPGFQLKAKYIIHAVPLDLTQLIRHFAKFSRLGICFLNCGFKFSGERNNSITCGCLR